MTLRQQRLDEVKSNRIKWDGCGEVHNDDTARTFEFLSRFNRVWIDSTEEIKRRMQLATDAYGELITVWKDKGIRL